MIFNLIKDLDYHNDYDYINQNAII